MLSMIVSIVVASYNLGGYTSTIERTSEDMAVLGEKVSALEDVVFVNGIYKGEKKKW